MYMCVFLCFYSFKDRFEIYTFRVETINHRQEVLRPPSGSLSVWLSAGYLQTFQDRWAVSQRTIDRMSVMIKISVIEHYFLTVRSILDYRLTRSKYLLEDILHKWFSVILASVTQWIMEYLESSRLFTSRRRWPYLRDMERREGKPWLDPTENPRTWAVRLVRFISFYLTSVESQALNPVGALTITESSRSHVSSKSLSHLGVVDPPGPNQVQV